MPENSRSLSPELAPIRGERLGYRNVLGFTVAAAGTSFPNVFSGMCVARQGKAGMAVANALGANVQNVFLALAIPWTVQAVFMEPSGHFELPLAQHAGVLGWNRMENGGKRAVREADPPLQAGDSGDLHHSHPPGASKLIVVDPNSPPFGAIPCRNAQKRGFSADLQAEIDVFKPFTAISSGFGR